MNVTVITQHMRLFFILDSQVTNRLVYGIHSATKGIVQLKNANKTRVTCVVDFLVGILSNGRVAGRGHGEQQRGGPACHQTGQIPAPPA